MKWEKKSLQIICVLTDDYPQCIKKKKQTYKHDSRKKQPNFKKVKD